jgi:hypothetical protein
MVRKRHAVEAEIVAGDEGEGEGDEPRGGRLFRPPGTKTRRLSAAERSMASEILSALPSVVHREGPEDALERRAGQPVQRLPCPNAETRVCN